MPYTNGSDLSGFTINLSLALRLGGLFPVSLWNIPSNRRKSTRVWNHANHKYVGREASEDQKKNFGPARDHFSTSCIQ